MGALIPKAQACTGKSPKEDHGPEVQHRPTGARHASRQFLGVRPHERIMPDRALGLGEQNGT